MTDPGLQGRVALATPSGIRADAAERLPPAHLNALRRYFRRRAAR